MKKVLKYGALAGVLALASCSQEEVQRVVTDADEIRYSSEVAAISRAADSYCNLDKPTEFNIWAFNADGSLYINDDRIVSNDLGNTYINASGVRYWPVDDKGDANADLDFFAARNHGETLTFTETEGYKNLPGFKDYTIKDNVTEQLDLIYASAMGKNKGHETVKFNFRHALSQICFRALNHTTNLDIAIKGVKIGHLSNKGDFTFPVDEAGKPQDTHETAVNQEEGATDATHPGNWVDGDHNDLPGNYENQQLPWQGVWSNRTAERGETLKGMTSADAYAVTPLGAAYTYGDAAYTAVPRSDKATRDYTNLTCPGKNHANGFAQVLTLLPQEMQAWNPEQKADTYNGAYFILDAVLENVTTDSEGNQVKTQVYQGNIAVPVDIAWYPGFRYIYTFIFDDEHQGGYTDNPSDPKPVLNPVKYEVTVDDFIPVEAGDHFIGGGDANGTNEARLNFFDGKSKTPIFAYASSDITKYYNPATKKYQNEPCENGIPVHGFWVNRGDENPTAWAADPANIPEGCIFGGWGIWDGTNAPTKVEIAPDINGRYVTIGHTVNVAPVWIPANTKDVTVKIYFFSFDESNFISETTVQVPEDATSFNTSLIPNIDVTRNGQTQTTCGFTPSGNTTPGQDVEIGADGSVSVKCIFRHILKVDFQGGNAPINSAIDRPWPNYWGDGGLVNESDNFGFDVTIWSEAPTREGYTFLGYSTKPNGPAEEQYALGNSFSIDAAELQLYAIWEANPVERYAYINFLDENENLIYTRKVLLTDENKHEVGGKVSSLKYKLTDEDKALYNNHIPAGLDMSLFLGWRTKGYPNSEPSIEIGRAHV